MMRTSIIGFLAFCSTPAAADVVNASSNGFEIRHTVNLVVKPEVAFQAFGNVAAWWNPEHTYSGSSANLSLTLTPGGCLCERFPKGGGIEHLHVTFVDPGKHLVLTGALGPLLYEATTGVLDVQVKSTGGGSQLIFDYRAAGVYKGGADKLAPIVDQVLADQVKRYRTFATARPRT
jgi:hypothetical protein